MEQYIKKSALVAEIEKLKRKIDDHDDYANGWHNALSSVETDINFLESKEVDFDALSILAEYLLACDAHAVSPKYRDGEYDLLEELKNNKAQKGE